MKLPNGDRAVVDIGKLRDYCLNPNHRRGCHKARVFAASLGLTIEGAEELRFALLKAARNNEAVPAEYDRFGKRYIIDFSMRGSGGEAVIRSLWIVRHGEEFARMTTCYVL